MAYIGELIMSAREACPDLPIQTLPAPSGYAGPPVPSIGSFGVLNPGLTYFFRATACLPWGESLPCAEQHASPGGANNQFTVTVTGIPVGAVAIKLYTGLLDTDLRSWMIFPVTSTSGTQSFLFTGANMVPGSIPIRNSAYLCDSDGKALSASRVFGWLNDGLKLAGQIVGGGIPDMGGVGTVAGQAWYDFMGNWKKTDGAWYDGYPLFFGRKSDVFRRNPTPGTSGILAIDQYAAGVRAELYPQPSRTSGVTALTTALGVAGTQAIVGDTSGFLLGFGLALLGTPANGEVVSYASFDGTNLYQLMRAWSGTTAQIWPIGTPVTELNLTISGYRIPSSYSVGDSLKVMNLPPGWEAALPKYVLGRFRDAEMKRQEAKDLMGEFQQIMSSLRVNKQYAGPIQIQPGGNRGAETYPGLGGWGGGVIVP